MMNTDKWKVLPLQTYTHVLYKTLASGREKVKEPEIVRYLTTTLCAAETL